jgi:hypothetical protein
MLATGINRMTSAINHITIVATVYGQQGFEPAGKY